MPEIAPVYGHRQRCAAARWTAGVSSKIFELFLRYYVWFGEYGHTHFLLDVDEANGNPDGKTVKIWFGDPNAN